MTQPIRVKLDRIRISLAAYAYEFGLELLMQDHEYDKLALAVEKSKDIPTDNSLLDNFFKTEFDRSTGMWIHRHPEISKIICLYYKLFPYNKQG